jgi:predicted unusual protein kinase regulating ubiquinone biosynthesis (AarF/ABC1/UbiB family)
MKGQENIPTSKVARATQFVKATVKVGGNYVKHYSKKILDPSLSKDELHADNARDVYLALSELKGSALKMAQMMSMDKSLLPRAYTEKFAMSQYSAPPLSAPLVMKTFKASIGKSPSEIFDTFDFEAANAASIGQVHRATKNGKKLAVKIQYPGVANSISSDLKMARPLATSLLNLNSAEIERYFNEVQTKLLEEADYELELKRSIEITELCSGIKNAFYPKYYPEFSSDRIITMDWLSGQHLKEYLLTNPSQENRNKIGQALWDFYHFQMHTLKAVHADPHPGNFLFTEDGKLGILDFGCIKVIPEDFYQNYFVLINPAVLDNKIEMMRIFKKLEFILAEDSAELQTFFFDLFYKMIEILGRPFSGNSFDFGNDAYVSEVYGYFEYVAGIKELKNVNAARGSEHGLYVNRTFFGLYTLLNDLKAKVNIELPEIFKNLEAKV